MSGLSSPSLVPSNDQGAGTCAFSEQDLRQILGLVRITFPTGAGKWLERATNASPRTVDYWLQGRYLPRGNRALAIVKALRAEHERRGRLLQQYEFNFLQGGAAVSSSGS